MIACWRSWAGAPAPRSPIASALTRYRGTAREHSTGSASFHWLATDGQSYGAAGPVEALLQGWIDNAGELAAQLGTKQSDIGAIYAAALAKWGDDADKHVIGNYASIARLSDGRLRLSRTPWSAPPLYYHSSPERVIVSPLHRVLFEAGAPRELDYDRIIDELAYDYRDGEGAGWYKGIPQVPLGCSVTISERADELNRWYSVEEIPQVRFPSDEQYVEAASRLLEEAGEHVLASSRKPAIALSGGLDSPLAADALTRAMPDGQRLQAITFVPHPDWDGTEQPGLIGNEAALARAFATHNGRIDLHLADPDQGGFDYRSREMLHAMQIFAPGLANVGMMHGVWSKAQELGCDMLVDAEMGNQTFSDNGRWTYVEYARAGKWHELIRLLRNRPGDQRSLPRKLMALSLLPQLPAALRQSMRGLVHPGRRDMTGLITLLSAETRQQHGRRAASAGRARAWDDQTHATSRTEAAQQYALQANGPAHDVHLAFEQLYGLRRRDIATYRPLVEFCLGLPSEQFASEGMERRLARRMAKGRMPEAQRIETRHGQHNVDWHARMTPRRKDLLEYAQAMRGHGWLSSVTDIDRMCDLIERWPASPQHSWEEDFPRMLGLPRIVLAAQLIGIVEGRNDL